MKKTTETTGEPSEPPRSAPEIRNQPVLRSSEPTGGTRLQPTAEGGKSEIINSLADLTALCAEPIKCTFTLDGREVTIPVRRLSPQQTDTIEAMRREVIPPLVKGRTQGEDRHNYDDPAFREKLARQQRMCRAMTVYLGCPLFADEQKGLSDRNAILDFVQSKLSETILEIIYLTITAEGIGREAALAERTNFTSAPEPEG